MKNEIIDTISRCKTFDITKELIEGYIDNYNNIRYQLPLAGLTPHEFYLYVTTGIYPLDNYFGVKADKLYTIEEIVDAKIRKKEEESRKRKEAHNKRRIETSKISNVEKILLRDQYILAKEISKWSNLKQTCDNQLLYLRDLYTRNCKAIIYYDDLSKEDKKRFENPLEWRDTPEMNYVMEMADLF